MFKYQFMLTNMRINMEIGKKILMKIHMKIYMVLNVRAIQRSDSMVGKFQALKKI